MSLKSGINQNMIMFMTNLVSEIIELNWTGVPLV